MRFLATLLCVFGLTILSAQREQIITAYPQLQQQYALPNTGKGEIPLGLTKSECGMPADGGIEAVFGEVSGATMQIDTSDFGGDGNYDCLNCSELNFGVVEIDPEVDSVYYNTNIGVDAGRDTVRIRYCTASGDTCTSVSSFIFVAQRMGLIIDEPAIDVNPGEAIDISMPNNLPGTLRCATLTECVPDGYEGTEQLAYLADYSNPTNSFVYVPSRVAGVDKVCLTICDDFGVCDVTRYSFRVSVPSLQLGRQDIIMDDFSNGSSTTKEDLWLDRAVYVNTDLAIDPPSVGVATFDGIDYRGKSYGGDPDVADVLTSTYISVAEGGEAPALTFWMQRGGRANRPDLTDTMELNFRNSFGEWERVWTLGGIRSTTPVLQVDTFKFYSVSLDDRFRHGRFQFRFSATGSRTGLRDVWHLDYVNLSFTDDGANFNDLAFMNRPDFLLGDYSSMPWRHFIVDPESALNTELPVQLFNHDLLNAGRIATTTPGQGYGFRGQELETGQEPFSPVQLLNNTDQNLDQGPNAYTYTFPTEIPFNNAWGQLLQSVNSGAFDEEERLEFVTTYAIAPNGQATDIASVRDNDDVSRSTVFSDYFSYDDGTAEGALETSQNTEVAVRYTATIADTIKGVRIHFPATGVDVGEQNFRLKIWVGELDDEPEFSTIYQAAFASTFFDTLQGFTSYPLVDILGNDEPLAIPAGDFYVGWEQITQCRFAECIGVGYDRNSPDARDFIFVKNNVEWEELTGVTRGALMLRPVMAGGDVFFTSTEEELPLADQYKIYPNPTNGQLFIRSLQGIPATGVAQLINMSGQVVWQGQFDGQIDMSDLPGGLYHFIARNSDGELLTQQRVVVVK